MIGFHNSGHIRGQSILLTSANQQLETISKAKTLINPLTL